MKSSEIQELIKFVAKSGVSEVEIENKDFKITIKTPPYKRGNQPTVEVIRQEVVPAQPQAAPVAPVAPVQPQAAPAAAPATPSAKKEEEDDANYVAIKSPMIGTFYRKPSPDKPNYVSVGDEVKNETVVCVIEAMKLFNEIEAEISGKIVKILVDDGSPVEYDQPLFIVDPI